ncbi:hypothetical protein KC678_02950 [Candidatus Dojkabacteria bacterium]|uniref:Uncharacterized protein n=1 Tax=Candidatus Dojkabacteria bacterium TaxID=2099670 RepID=A0A955L1B3_9BACT|nr:hypothetical protein [Candidatus Dojkabacteria bacterium]
MAKKGKELNNSGEVNVEKKGSRVDIFHGSGGTDPHDRNSTKTHSHTVIENNQIVYDRDEKGTVFLDTNRGDSPSSVSSNDS